MRIAVVGAGISGLVAASKLCRDHEITVFEANHYVGGHTNTVDVEIGGQHHAVDTGFIVYNERTYPNFTRLLSELNVATHPTEMSFSVRDDKGRFEYNGHSLSTLFARRSNFFRPSFHRMLLDILRFNREAARLERGEVEDVSVRQFVRQRRYSQAFVDWYLLPLGASIWSCPTGTFSGFPIRFIIEFFQNHGLLGLSGRPVWRVVTGGSRRYVEALTSGFRDRIFLRSPVESVRRQSDRVEVVASGSGPQTFDHVIFACHSDQALRILGDDATATERELLGAFPWSRNLAVLHTDASLLPVSRKAWASWNFRLTGEPGSPATVTYDMNRLQGLRTAGDLTFCVTLNGEQWIDPARVLGRFEYHHPVFTTNRQQAQNRHSELCGANRTSFCGAYWRNGFHEDGVVSALRVVKAIQMNRDAFSPVLEREGVLL
jgi:uncharacterized protein